MAILKERKNPGFKKIIFLICGQAVSRNRITGKQHVEEIEIKT